MNSYIETFGLTESEFDDIQQQLTTLNTMTITADAPVQIRGNTYNIREELKALGGRWNPEDKVWEVPSRHAAQAQALVAKQPPKTAPIVDVSGWLRITGRTYEAKDVLKAKFRARWDGASKAWLVAPEHHAAAQSLVDDLNN